MKLTLVFRFTDTPSYIWYFYYTGSKAKMLWHMQWKQQHVCTEQTATCQGDTLQLASRTLHPGTGLLRAPVTNVLYCLGAQGTGSSSDTHAKCIKQHTTNLFLCLKLSKNHWWEVLLKQEVFRAASLLQAVKNVYHPKKVKALSCKEEAIYEDGPEMVLLGTKALVCGKEIRKKFI